MRVLITVSTFNQADYFLPLCLESIKAQTYKNFICIVGDDRSTDNTEEVVRKFGKKFIYHRTPRKYVLNSYFYNWCAKNYRNEFFATIDGDNIYLPDHTEKLLEKMHSGDYVAVYGWANNIVYGDDNRTIKQKYFRGEPWEINRYVYGTSYYNFIDMSDILFRRKYFLGAGGYVEGLGYQDYSIMVRLAIKYNNRIGYVPQVLSLYAKREGAQSVTRDADENAHCRVFAV